MYESVTVYNQTFKSVTIEENQLYYLNEHTLRLTFTLLI